MSRSLASYVLSMPLPKVGGRADLGFLGVLALVGSTLVGQGSPAEEFPATVSFQSGQSWPIATEAVSLLRAKCVGCHGADPTSMEAELDLRTREGLLAGGWSEEPTIVPGDPDASPLYIAITWEEAGFEMPPKESERLTQEEVETIGRWIQDGAPWPEEREIGDPRPASNAWSTENDASGVRIATSGGQSSDWDNRTYREEEVWAYRRPMRRPVPWDALDETAPKHPIDAFIAAKLRPRGLSPAPPATRSELVRRATVGLTGLPPTWEDVEQFEADDRDGAMGHLVEQLLASHRYAEQMARHWIDVVRYADTSGFANDFERPNAWRYRDYLVRAFDEDRPYDRFIVEQLAGDELDPTDPEMQIAVGFLRSGPWEHTSMSVAAVTRQQYLDDVTHGVGVTFLAQGLRCASCHDHKFDPISTKDYYRMQSVFAPVQFVDRKVPYRSFENTSSFAQSKPRTERLLKESQKYLASLAAKSTAALNAYLRERGVERVKDLSREEQPDHKGFGLTQLELSLQKIHQKRVAYYQLERKRYQPYAFSVYNGPANGFTSTKPLFEMPTVEDRQGSVQAVHVLAGGSLEAAGEVVTPGVLSAVAGSNDRLSPNAWNTIPNTADGRRLALARWIASPGNSLTARVMVNRVWQMHFGTGLVATPNSFGVMGSRPTHPELLDWLAVWFVEHDWSLKRLHRLIMTSDTYARSSLHPEMERLIQLDPENELLAYFPPRRLAAEEIRDGMLAVTGELSTEMGGPGFYPEIHWEVALQPRHIMGSVAPAYQPSPAPEQRHRRTLYAFRYRTLADPMLEVFNRPGADVSCERRDQTTVTPQVFSLLNGQFVHDRALALALRLEASAADMPGRIELAFRWVYGRPATDAEKHLVREHVERMVDHHRRHEPESRTLPTVVRREMVEELTGEPFAWDETLDVMPSYVSDAKPWQVGPETRALAELCLVLLNSNEFVYVR